MCLSIFLLLGILLSLVAITFVFPMPIGDVGGFTRYKTFPWMTLSIIIINTLVFMAWLAPKLYGSDSLFGGTLEAQVQAIYPYIKAVWTYGYREEYIRNGTSIGAGVAFTAIFMHGDMWHLFGNMVYLWTFGRRLEDACGPWRFLVFYLIAGMIASVGSTLLNPSAEDVPGIGASGAIAGVLGAYLLLFFDKKIATLWGIGSIGRFFYRLFNNKDRAPLFKNSVNIPAWTLLIFFAIQNTVFGLITITEGQGAGTNYLAHFVGFIGGLFVFLFLRKDLLIRYMKGRTL